MRGCRVRHERKDQQGDDPQALHLIVQNCFKLLALSRISRERPRRLLVDVAVDQANIFPQSGERPMKRQLIKQGVKIR